MEEFEPSLIVMDSISSIEHSSSEKGFRQFMIGVASLLREHGRSALLTQTVTGPEAGHHTAPYLSTIADAILSLDYSEEYEDCARSLRVLKMRGRLHDTHPYRLPIGQGGLQVEPPTIRPMHGGEDSQHGRLPAARARRAGTAAARYPCPPGRGFQRRPRDRDHHPRGRAEVTATASSAEGLARLDQQVPDLILADIGLPQEDGMEFIRKVRARPGKEKDVPAVALTGWGLQRDRVRSKEAAFSRPTSSSPSSRPRSSRS